MSTTRPQHHVNIAMRDRYILPLLEAEGFLDPTFGWVACMGDGYVPRTIVSCDTKTGIPNYVSLLDNKTGLYHLHKLTPYDQK